MSEYARLRGVYRRWAPVYDRLLGPLFRDARRRSIAGLQLGVDDAVVLPGIGTGLDLPLLPRVRRAAGIDMTAEMLARAAHAGGASAPALLVADAQRMPLQDGAFDAAVLHLILAVAPDGRAVLAETCRVVRPGGRIAVFDKFASEGGASAARRALNAVARRAGTEITRQFGAMWAGLPLAVTREESAIRGAYRIIWLRRTDGADGGGIA